MISEVLAHPVLASIGIIFVAILLRFIVSKLSHKRSQQQDFENRHFSHSIRHLINLVTLLLLLVLWGAEIQNFALSLAAFAVAIVLALREFIQSIIGFFYLVTTRPFRVGDWIEVDEDYGEVAKIDWVKTTLIQIDINKYQLTRSTIAIPNSKLVVSTITNLNFIKRYVTHTFSIVREEKYNGFRLYESLMEKAKHYCEGFSEVAARYNSILERRLDAKITDIDPEIRFSTTELGHFKADITLFCPTESALELERKLSSDFLDLWDDLRRRSDKG